MNQTFWYLIALSSASIVFAIATLGVLGSFSPTKSDLIDLERIYHTGDPQNPQNCGGKQPWAYCYTETYTYGISTADDTAWKMLGFCLVVMCCLVASKLNLRGRSAVKCAFAWLRRKESSIFSGKKSSSTIEREPQSTGLRSRDYTHLPIPTGFDLRVPFFKNASRRTHQQKEVDDPVTYQALKICVCLSFIGIYLWYIKLYLSNLKVFASKDAYDDTWTFGQVVALTIWVPPLCEYVHYEMRKYCSPCWFPET